MNIQTIRAQADHLEQVYNLAVGIKKLTKTEKQDILDDKIRDENR